MVKLISLVCIAVIGYQTWQNIEQTKQQNELKTVQFFNPAKQYLTGVISSLHDGELNLKFKNFKTEAVVPGRMLKGYFDVSFDQKDNYNELNDNKVESVSLKSRAHFKAEVALTSTDGEYWTTKIVKVQNTQQDFIEPMEITVTQ